MLTVIERARRYISKCPPAISGQGGHNATFHIAAVLVQGFALGEADALALLREYNRACQPPWGETELVHKVRSAATAQHNLPRGHLLGEGVESPMPEWQTPKWMGMKFPTQRPDPVAATERYLAGFGCAELEVVDASPIRLDSESRFDGALLVETLYGDGEKINFVTEFAADESRMKATPRGFGVTMERDALASRFRGNGTDASDAGGWLRMNPVDGAGVGDANVTAFRFALLESDALPLELQLALFARLPLPIAAILSSGGKSVHAWVRVDASGADEYRRAVSRLLTLVGRFGVDGKNKNPSRLSRLPGAKRVIGAVGDGIQRLLYLNPMPEQRRVLE